MMDADGETKDLPIYLKDISTSIQNTSGSFNPYLQKDYLFALGVLIYYEEI
jgi:hypothetical protein